MLTKVFFVNHLSKKSVVVLSISEKRSYLLCGEVAILVHISSFCASLTHPSLLSNFDLTQLNELYDNT